MRVSGIASGMMAAMIVAGGLIGGAAAMADALQVIGTKDGVDAWQRGDYTGAVAIWRPLADHGDADAAYDLAQAYKLGRGVPLDLAQAKTLYGVAARAGHLRAAANYGLLLFQDGDRGAAMPWIKKASDDGDPRAQYVYGTALFNGDLTAKDWPRAYALMTRAAAAGLPQATTSLSQMDQFLSPADRQKGLALASTLAARPLPPINRQMTVASEVIPPQLPPAPVPVRRVQVAAATPTATAMPSAPPPPAAQPAAPKPAKAAKPAKPPVAVAAAAPAAPPAAPAPLASANGRWQVQLGAFASQALAASVWSQVAAKSAALRTLSPRYERAGPFVRLRAGGLADKAATARACAAARVAGIACFPVAP